MTKKNNIQDKLDLILKVAEARNADVIYYHGTIDRESVEFFIHTSEHLIRRENAILIIKTPGGDPDAAYKLCRFFHRNYNNLYVLIEDYCKSAGTLIALGADFLIMGRNGELGPLDIQRVKDDELGARVSGLNLSTAINKMTEQALESFVRYLHEIRFGSKGSIKTTTAAEIASNLVLGLYGQIFDKVEPHSLGDIERSVQIAISYANRINRGNQKEGSIASLVYDYPCHSFVIDREEAEHLFNNVELPNDSEVELLYNLTNLVQYLIKRQHVQFIDGGAIVFNFNVILEEYEKSDKFSSPVRGNDQEDNVGRNEETISDSGKTDKRVKKTSKNGVTEIKSVK